MLGVGRFVAGMQSRVDVRTLAALQGVIVREKLPFLPLNIVLLSLLSRSGTWRFSPGSLEKQS
jgi:hypothetical protein